jgi:hypothetical protein
MAWPSVLAQFWMNAIPSFKRKPSFFPIIDGGFK